MNRLRAPRASGVSTGRDDLSPERAGADAFHRSHQELPTHPAGGVTALAGPSQERATDAP
jgi:hypothetical protein